MIKSSGISRFVGFSMSMVFSVGVIFFCSFGIVSVFQVLSNYGLDDMSELSAQGADGVVAAMTGITINEDEIESGLVGKVKDVIYSMENKENYSFEDATNDAKSVLSDLVNDDGEITSGVEEIKTSITNLLEGSSSEEAVKEYVDQYLSGTE